MRSMRLARPLLLATVALVLVCCLALAACSDSPYGPANGTPAPTTSSGY